MNLIACKPFNYTQHPLPSGWRWVKLEDVCVNDIETYNPLLEPRRQFHYIDISSIDNIRKIITETTLINGTNPPSRARQIIKAGDILVSTTRPNLNAVACVPHSL